MGFGLVPEDGRSDVVLEGEIAEFVAEARAPAEGLDRDTEIIMEPDRVLDVPAILPQARFRLQTLNSGGRLLTRRTHGQSTGRLSLRRVMAVPHGIRLSRAAPTHYAVVGTPACLLAAAGPHVTFVIRVRTQ